MVKYNVTHLIVDNWNNFLIQGSANPQTPGLVNFVPDVAYHFCLNLPETFSQPGVRQLADPCKVHSRVEIK